MSSDAPPVRLHFDNAGQRWYGWIGASFREDDPLVQQLIEPFLEELEDRCSDAWAMSYEAGVQTFVREILGSNLRQSVIASGAHGTAERLLDALPRVAMEIPSDALWFFAACLEATNIRAAIAVGLRDGDPLPTLLPEGVNACDLVPDRSVLSNRSPRLADPERLPIVGLGVLYQDAGLFRREHWQFVNPCDDRATVRPSHAIFMDVRPSPSARSIRWTA